MQKLENEEWVDCTEEDLSDGDIYRIPVGQGGWQQQVYMTPVKESVIFVTVSLSKPQCEAGETISYTITFSEEITVPDIVPISVSDRNGDHITNIGCTVIDGTASGSFVMEKAGDFTVTNEAINYHNILIDARLELTGQPWLRVYQ